MLRVVAWWSLWAAASAQVYQFCTDGLESLDVADDKGVPSVDLIVMQAPLFSTNPKIGQKLRWLGMFHTAVTFAQEAENETVNYWTLEFDFTNGSILAGVMPKIEGGNLVWDNDARFCLSKGLMWGRDHWTQSFEKVARLTSQQARDLITGFVLPLNASAHGGFPQYQLWRLGRPDHDGIISDPFVPDVTCADGVNWLLHHVVTKMGVALPQGFQLKATSIAVNAQAVSEVDTTDPEEWNKVVIFYERMIKFNHNSTTKEKLFLFLEMMWHEYMYDTNTGKYYRVWGSHFPFFRSRYIAYNLTAPPSAHFVPHQQNLVVQI